MGCFCCAECCIAFHYTTNPTHLVHQVSDPALYNGGGSCLFVCCSAFKTIFRIILSFIGIPISLPMLCLNLVCVCGLVFFLVELHYNAILQITKSWLFLHSEMPAIIHFTTSPLHTTSQTITQTRLSPSSPSLYSIILFFFATPPPPPERAKC